MNTFLEEKRGTTLIETIVSIALLTMVLIGPIALAQKAITTTRFSQNQIVATFLAQDVVEYFISLHGQNVINDDEFTSRFDNCISDTCFIDTTQDVATYVPSACGGEENCPQLTRDPDTGTYSYSEEEMTPFTRFVNITVSEDLAEMAVEVTLEWVEGSSERTFTIETYLFDMGGEKVTLPDLCEDPNANNFGDPIPCTYPPPPPPVPGCTDENANNHDPDATVDDGSCTYDPVPGCTDPDATNYNPNADVDDGSCTYPIPGCTDPDANNYDPDATANDGSCTYDPVPGCTDPDATNYDPNADVDDGSCTYPIPGCTDPGANNYDPNATVDDGSCTYDPVPGCTDPDADNHDPDATVDDGSCTYPIPGCTDPDANNYDPDATANDGSCTYDPVPGCTDPEANNYNPNANVDDGSCTYDPVIPGCTNDRADNYDPDATDDDGSCTYTLSADIEARGSSSDPYSDGPITIFRGSSASIRWTSSGAQNCFVSPTGWAGTTNPGISTGSLDDSITYTIGCTDPGFTFHSNLDSVIVNVQGDF